MARTNMKDTRVRPATTELLTLEVVRRERISPSFGRVTLGGDDAARFEYMGFDQWFRLFLPVSETSLSRLPAKLDMISYLRYMTVSKTERPVLRNYTIAGFRPSGPNGPEIDVDFVLHGSAAEGTAGPAATWAETCRPGDAVAMLNEGTTYNPPVELRASTFLVADESALPAALGILASLPEDTRGTAVLEVPDAGDRREVEGPVGVDVRWLFREDPGAAPGDAALAAVAGRPLPSEPFFAWVAGEQSLPIALRRHWVAAGVPKSAISFTGYWRRSARH